MCMPCLPKYACNTKMLRSVPKMLLNTTLGHCGPTEWNSGDCSLSYRGSFHWSSLLEGRSRGNASRHRQPLLDDCARLCLRCEGCNFISFSPTERDCSWYYECDLAALSLGTDHVSANVREANDKHEASMNPPATSLRHTAFLPGGTGGAAHVRAAHGVPRVVHQISSVAHASVRQPLLDFFRRDGPVKNVGGSNPRHRVSWSPNPRHRVNWSPNPRHRVS